MNKMTSTTIVAKDTRPAAANPDGVDQPKTRVVKKKPRRADVNKMVMKLAPNLREEVKAWTSG